MPQGDHETVGSIALVALLQSALSMQQQQTLHQNSTKARGLLVSSHTFPNQLHDCMTPFWDIRTRKDILGCKRRIALCILCSVFKHPLSPDHVCTCNWGPNGVGWHKLVFLQLSRRKSMRHGPAHDQHCKYMQHFRFVGESMLLFESISWGGTSNRRKGLQQIQSSLQETQTIWSNSKDFWKWPPPSPPLFTAPSVVLEQSMPKWIRHKDLKHQQNHLPNAKRYKSCKPENNFLNFC